MLRPAGQTDLWTGNYSPKGAVRFRAAIYFIVASDHVYPLLHKAEVGLL